MMSFDRFAGQRLGEHISIPFGHAHARQVGPFEIAQRRGLRKQRYDFGDRGVSPLCFTTRRSLTTSRTEGCQ